MKLLVVGAGAMGRWFADSVGAEADTIGFADTDPDTTRVAVDDVGGHVVDPRTDESFDVVCIAVPMPVVESVIARYGTLADRAICDVTGCMRKPITAMCEHAPDVERVSLHPLFAPERAPGTVAMVTDRPGETTETLRERLEADGNEVFETSPDEHDEAMETVQARTHTAILAFALAAEDVPDNFQTPVSAGLFDLVDQVSEGDSRVYADIQGTFDGADDLASAARKIADADAEAFHDIYERLS